MEAEKSFIHDPIASLRSHCHRGKCRKLDYSVFGSDIGEEMPSGCSKTFSPDGNQHLKERWIHSRIGVIRSLEYEVISEIFARRHLLNFVPDYPAMPITRRC
jgi:hypothetical protein